MKPFQIFLTLLLLSLHSIAFCQEPIKLLPENPHYFEYKGKPLALITSAEHYGALVNLDFDFEKYLKTLHQEGMNYTRIFMGSYFEIASTSFGIKYNTLAPEKNRVITPWKTVERDGRILYDWSSYNPSYFERLHKFMRLAEELDIIVEVTFFSSIYTDEHWEINPQNPLNRTDSAAPLERKLVHTTQNGSLLELQKSYVSKLVTELNPYPNFFFEIQNEPWSDRGRSILNLKNQYSLDAEWTEKIDIADSLSLAWQDEMVKTIVETENGLPKNHLIAQNYSNFYAPLSKISEHISILNFHYNWPQSATMNYHWDRVIGFDESGFAGNSDMVYRRQAWAFLFSGGGLFNNLDYSFFTGKEDGTLVNEAPGGGSVSLRKQLKILHDFFHSFDLKFLTPNQNVVVGSPGFLTYAMKNGNQGYGFFVVEAGEQSSYLKLNVPPGTYRVELLNTLTGELKNIGSFQVTVEELILTLKLNEGEIAFKLIKE
ncbi:hypothetical protein [Algoriphagus formosus]|uniref:Glycoside hydrolase family 5 domain-containing protein n=1 Tax=Algoriphagus formosus TaxID=2007308 RepID=A0A4R5US79_9BACT|nr:hypothetical protein [Algoriphagus aquimaris]TDK41913.1 hypothetical protein E1898_18225 [Algoriphagus aquimaris]